MGLENGATDLAYVVSYSTIFCFLSDKIIYILSQVRLGYLMKLKKTNNKYIIDKGYFIM